MTSTPHSDQAGMKHLRIGFIGAGKAGVSLGKHFQSHGIVLSGYFSRTAQNAQEAAEFTGSKSFLTTDDLIKESDIVFLTVPDQAIKTCFESLDHTLVKEKIICHCSGALSSQDAFPHITELEAFGCSVHPLFAINDRFSSFTQLGNAFFCIEGDEKALQVITQILKTTNNPVRAIGPQSKTLYHCAAAIASNHVVALVYESLSLLQECGFAYEEALMALTPILTGNMHRIAQDGPVKALTGPIERGDATTVSKHLNALSNPDDKDLYRLLSGILVKVAQEKHPDRDYRSIENVISM